MATIPVATRLTLTQLAKARDGLILKGIAPQALMTKSSILRLSVFLAITMIPDPKELPSAESLSIVEQI